MKKYRIQKVVSLLASMVFTLGVAAQEVKGDVVTTVADKGTSGMFIATLCPKKDVAIDKNLAETFSIYLEKGFPYLMKMRVQANKFVVKAGDCVIVKTTEAAVIPLEETTKKSSVWYSDIFCPSEDLTVEAFLSTHTVKAGECIYLLTNMAKNGGFGFTKFTGNLMKQGNFFIIGKDNSPSTTRGTRAAEDVEDGDLVPFLKGEAGNDDGFTAQSAYAKGDANGDGKINVADVVEMVNYIAGKPSASFVFSAADVNKDSKVNTADVELTVNNLMTKK